MICPKSLKGYQSHSLDSQPGKACMVRWSELCHLTDGHTEAQEGKGFAQYTRAWAASGIVLGPCFLEPHLAWPGSMIWAELQQ